MPTVTQIVTQIAPISQYLAANDISNGQLYGPRINQFLAVQIYIVQRSIKYRYDVENIAGGTSPSAVLNKAANWLLQLCGNYGTYALSLVNGGGIIPGVNPAPASGYNFPPMSAFYVATVEGEAVFTIRDINGGLLPVGTLITWAEKGVTFIDSNQFTFSNSIITLLNGYSLSEGEKFSYQYITPVT